MKIYIYIYSKLITLRNKFVKISPSEVFNVSSKLINFECYLVLNNVARDMK